VRARRARALGRRWWRRGRGRVAAAARRAARRRARGRERAQRGALALHEQPRAEDGVDNRVELAHDEERAQRLAQRRDDAVVRDAAERAAPVARALDHGAEHPNL